MVIGGLLAMVVAIAVIVAVPLAIYSAVKALNHIGSAIPVQPPLPIEVDARLRRMEEAIDAMAQQIERLRVPDRYVSGERVELKQLPTPDDPPTFR